MPRRRQLLLLFCLVSGQLAATSVMARHLPAAFVVFDGGADAPFASAGGGHARSLLLEPGSLAGPPMPLGLSTQLSHHRPFDRTFTGGKIILVGLTAAIVVSVFCYIRITRAKKNDDEPKS